MYLADRNSLIDMLGLDHGSTVSIYFSDLISDEFEENIEFTVLSITPTNDENIKKLNCLESSIFDSIQKQPSGIYFNRKPVSFILRQLFPKIDHFDIDPFPILGDFHIQSGSQVNVEIEKQLCRQYASMCWISRNKLYFKSIMGLFGQDPIATYTNNLSNDKAYQIQKPYPIKSKNTERTILREYHGYHHEHGFLKGGIIGGPKTITDFGNKVILDNLAVGSKLVMNILAPGNGLVEPCKMLNFEWDSNNPEMPINESLTDSALVTRINHSMEGEQHRMELGVSEIIHDHY